MLGQNEDDYIWGDEVLWIWFGSSEEWLGKPTECLSSVLHYFTIVLLREMMSGKFYSSVCEPELFK